MRVKTKFIVFLSVIMLFISRSCTASSNNPDSTPTEVSTQTADAAETLLAFHTELARTLEALIASQTVTPTPTFTMVPTVTPTLTHTLTPTETPTLPPAVTLMPLPTTEIDNTTAHSICGDRASILISVNGVDGAVVPMRECWRALDQVDGWTHYAPDYTPSIFGEGFVEIVRFDYLTMIFQIHFQKSGPEFDTTSIQVHIPFAFQREMCEISVGVDDNADIEAWFDDGYEAFDKEHFDINQGVVIWPLDVTSQLNPDEQRDGFFRIIHHDTYGGSSVYFVARCQP